MYRIIFGKFMIPLSILLIIMLASACNKPTPGFKCNDNLGCVHVAPEEPIKIGVLQALSGKVASLGQEQIRGIGLALDKRHGKIKSHPVTLQIEDTGCSPQGGANAALKIIADPQQVAILGTTCSGAAAAVSKTMSDAGLTMISGNNSAPFLTAIAGKQAPNWQNGYFRTAHNEENAGKAAAIYAHTRLNIHTAAAINDGDIYTRGLTDGFVDAFVALGGKIVLNTSINKGDKEMEPVLKAVLNSKAELLFFPLFQPEGNLLLFQARKMPGFDKITLMSDGSLIDSSFIEDAKDKGKGMYFVGPSAPVGPDIDLLAETYRSTYGEKPGTSYYLSAYDSADLLFTAIEKIAVKDPDESLHIGRKALRDELYSTKNFKGITGSLTCDEFGDCSRPIFNVLRLDNPSQGVDGLKSNVMFTYAPEK